MSSICSERQAGQGASAESQEAALIQAQETIQLLGGKTHPGGDTESSKQKSEDLNSGSFGSKKIFILDNFTIQPWLSSNYVHQAGLGLISAS